MLTELRERLFSSTNQNYSGHIRAVKPNECKAKERYQLSVVTILFDNAFPALG